MFPELPPTIAITAIYWGPDTFVVSRCWHRIGALFLPLSRTIYSPSIGRFAICLNVDGALGTCGFVGVQGVRRSKNGVIRCNLGVPTTVWRDRPIEELKAFLARNVVCAFESFISRLEQAHVMVQSDELRRDVGDVLETFLAEDADYEPGKGEAEIHSALRRWEELRRLAIALGDKPPPTGLPEGWRIELDPADKSRVIIEPPVN